MLKEYSKNVNPTIVFIYTSSYIVFMFLKCTCSGLIDILIQAPVLILWGFLSTLIKFLSMVGVWMGGIIGRLILKIDIFKIGMFYITLLVYISGNGVRKWAEWGRRGSAWAGTLGKLKPRTSGWF